MTLPAAALIPALPVPFAANGDLDLDGLRTLLRAVEASGVDGAFTPGTTGEFTALDDDERLQVIGEALSVFGPERVVAHVGAASARHAQRLAAGAVALGAVNLAAITPYYLPAGDRSLIDYYQRLAVATSDAQAGARIFVYLFQARSTTTVTPAQLARLAEIPAVVGAKISGEPAARVLEYLDAVPAGFSILTGNNHEFADIVRAGGTGCVSAVASLFPAPFVEMADALRHGDEQAAAAAQIRIEHAVRTAGGGSIPLLKAGLAMRGLPSGPCRVALDEPTEEQLQALRTAVADLT